MAKVQRIVVHCTGEPADAKRNRAYYNHFFFTVKGWQHYGYHIVVYQDGCWEVLQQLPRITDDGGMIDYFSTANGAKGYDDSSLHIAYVGGLDPQSGKPADTRTTNQIETLKFLVAKYKALYKVSEILGHNQLPLVKKACPCFDARKEYADV